MNPATREPSAEAAEAAPAWLRLRAPEVLFLAVTTAAGLWARGRWLDPSGDPGIWWSLSWRLAQGERYYRDAYLQYGPLSPYLLSWTGRPFGYSALWYLLAGWIPAILAGLLLLELSRGFLTVLERFGLVGLLLGLSIFAPGPGRMVLSYCPAAVHAVVFSVAAFLVLRAGTVGGWPAYGAGALAGLAFCAKQEIGVAALAGLCAPILTGPRRAAGWVIRCVLGFLAVGCLGVAAAIGSGASVDSLARESHLWPVGVVPAEWLALFRDVAAVTAIDWSQGVLASLREMLKLIVLVSLIGLLLAKGRGSGRWWPSVGLLVLLFAADLISGRSPLPQVRPIGLSMTVALVVAAIALFDRRRPHREFFLGFGLFAGLVAARTAFSQDVASHFTGVAHFAATLTWAFFLFCFVPGFLPGGSLSAARARLAWGMLVLPLAWYWAASGISSLGDAARVAVETPRGRVWAQPRAAASYARIGRELRPGERVLFLPETSALDVLFGVRDASPYLIHMPGWLDAHAEDVLIDRFEREPPDAVVLFERATDEFHVKPFGQGFGRRLSDWILRNYEPVVVAPSAKVLRRRSPLLETDRRLAGQQAHRRRQDALEPQEEREGPGRDDPPEPDPAGESVEEGRVMPDLPDGQVGELPLEPGSVPFEDDPGLGDVGSREAAEGLEPPVRSVLVVRLGGEEHVEPLPEPCVSGLDEGDAPAGPQDAGGFAQEAARVGQMVEDVEHHHGRDGAVRKIEPLGRHDPVDVVRRLDVRRDRPGKKLLEKSAAGPQLDDRPVGNSSKARRQLSIVLSVDGSQERFPLDHPPMDADEFRRVVIDAAHLGQLEAPPDPAGG